MPHLNGHNSFGQFFKISYDGHRGHVLVAKRSGVYRIADGACERLDIPELKAAVKHVTPGLGNTWLVLHDNGRRVCEVKDPDGDLVVTELIHSSTLEGTQLVVTSDGSVFVSEECSHRIRCWTEGATNPITVAGGNGAGSGLNQLHNPRGFVVTADRSIYIADQMNNRVVKWEAGSNAGSLVAGGYTPGTGCHQCKLPIDIAIDDAGAIYVLEYTNHRVSKWGPAPSLQTFFP